VQVVQVDAVGLQAAQAGLDGAGEVEAAGAVVVGSLAHGGDALGGQDHVIALAIGLQHVAQDLLGGAAAVDVSGVDEVDATLECDVGDARGLGLVGAVAPGHRAQAQLRDAHAAAPQLSVLHDTSLSHLYSQEPDPDLVVSFVSGGARSFTARG